ncbi:hypothetical protein [Rhodococcus sp. WWJCD1]|nr:hypothetical protein [Rhodococcus sp. WWJCD1]
MSSELISLSEAVAGEATLMDVRCAPSRVEFGTVAGAIVVDNG